MKFSRLKTRDDRGAAAVEFALVLVPLLLIVGGIMDGGWLFADKIALNQSVREGTRIAVVQPGPTGCLSGGGTIETCVEEAAGETFIGDATDITVTTTGTCETPGVGNDITVTATYLAEPPLGLVDALTGPGNILGPTTLTSSATFRCEW